MFVFFKPSCVNSSGEKLLFNHHFFLLWLIIVALSLFNCSFCRGGGGGGGVNGSFCLVHPTHKQTHKHGSCQHKFSFFNVSLWKAFTRTTFPVSGVFFPSSDLDLCKFTNFHVHRFFSFFLHCRSWSMRTRLDVMCEWLARGIPPLTSAVRMTSWYAYDTWILFWM